MTGENDVLRFLIKRLASHADSACEIDYGRIEELAYLIRVAMLPQSFCDPLALAIEDGLKNRQAGKAPRLNPRTI